MPALAKTNQKLEIWELIKEEISAYREAQSGKRRLPQELIDQIIDEVALICINIGDTRLWCLRACTLVAKSFYPRSHYHFYSQLKLTLDKYGRRHVEKRLRFLGKHKSTANFILHNLHTFCLVYQRPPPPSASFFSRMLSLGGTFSGFNQRTVSRTLTTQDEHVHDLLKTLCQAPIVNFSIEGVYAFHVRNPDEDQFINNVLRVIQNPSLRTLQFNSLVLLPCSIVNKALHHQQLRELSIRQIGHLIPAWREDHAFRSPLVSSLEKLELSGVSYTSFMMTITNATGIPSVTSFPHLRTLVVTVPKLTEMESLWRLLEGLQSTLENLELLNMMDTIGHPWPEMARLSDLVSLKRLTFTSSLTYRTLELYEGYITNFLDTAASPMPLLQSIEINLYKQSPQGSHKAQKALLRSEIGWKEIDRALNNPNFMNLETVTCNIKPFYNPEDLDLMPYMSIFRKIESEKLSPTQFLPFLASSSSGDVNVYLMSMSTPHYTYHWR